MSMNKMDQEEIVKATVDGFRVRCQHKNIDIGDLELQAMGLYIGEMLKPFQDNTGMIGGDWDNG
jgi:hypothetical protein